MNGEGKSKLVAAGVDYDGALHRFLNNEAMYERFLLKFPEDVNYENIVRLEAEGKFGEIFSFAHTLKGTAGNLGLTPISTVASAITELCRGKSGDEIDKAAVSMQIAKLTEVNAAMCQVIKSI